ncbi:hypothetical protein E1A91_D08G138000v1 [Gossypium mustelinum]|uniref:Uncharacterized protein n=1 Tax=Gossypium mustelinum TaxID=34275 RepID=A0A5D2TY95_GOSMU|nr:hypothetical protein E1A91_D08G138000v1 [Gossypium mustelinum]
MLLKDAVYMTQPVYREHRVNSVEANQFNSNIGSSLLEDGVYTAQPVYSERRVNLVKANNLNGHVGSSLLEDGVYIAKSVYLKCRVNSLQEKTLNGHVGSSLQDELLSSMSQTLQQQKGLLNQPARAIPTYPLSGTRTGTGTRTSISSIVFNSLLQNETGDTSNSHQIKTTLSSYRKGKDSGQQRPTPARTRYGVGESSSSFKQFRREPSTLPIQQRDPSTLSMPMPIPVTNAEHENRNLLSMHNETNTSSNATNLSRPRPIKNSLYGPLFKGIGLPVDPHLRMFATM